MFISINLLLGTVLFLSIAYILVKKILIGIKGTDSGVLNLILIVLGLVGLYCTMSVFLGVKYLSTLQTDTLQQDIDYVKKNNIVSFAVGYASLLLDYIVYKYIERRNKKKLLAEKSHWNWNKLQ